MKIHPAWLRLFIPVAARWARWHEARILRLGKPLSARGMEDAAQMGVAEPERIRILEVGAIPFFNGWIVHLLSRFIPTISPRTVGLSLRYGIYVRKPFGEDRHLVAHECVHTGQYERAGSIPAFLMAYFTGCIQDGYPDTAMEQEAIMRSAALGGPRR